MKKKIIFVVTKGSWGGAQRYVFDLATNLSRNRFEIIVASGETGLLTERLKENAIKTIVIPAMARDISLVQEFKVLWTLFTLFRKEKPNIVHLNSSKAGGIGAIAAFLHNKLQATSYKLQAKVIFTAHGWAFHEERPVWQKHLIILASRFTALFQNVLIHVSEYDRTTTLQRHIASEKKTTVVYPAIKTEDFLSKEESRKFLFPEKNDENTVYIGTIAELTKNKGLANFIESVNQIKLKANSYKLQAVIIGDGEEREKLQNQITSLKLENTLCLAGFLPDAAQYLKAFDIFILPSLKEGFPYVLLEASVAGVPIIATRVGGIPELITNGENGLLVPPGNAHTLAEAINRLANDQDLRQRFATAGIQKIRERFSFPEMLEKTIAVYDNMKKTEVGK